jgi:YjjG family noncanonical pyrimidine nucleotidase
MSYDILLFDADRTLYDFDKSEELAFYEIAPKYGVDCTSEIFNLYREINHKNWEDLEKGLLSKERIVVRRFEQLLSALNITGADASKMNDDYLNALSTKSILFEDTIPLLERLKKAGKRIFIITNGVTKVQLGRIKGSPLEAYVEKLFISEQMGVSKPQKLFFDLVANEITNYVPQRALVIGDSLTSDIQGANNAGLDCVWLNQDNKIAPEKYSINFTAFNLAQIGDFILSKN